MAGQSKTEEKLELRFSHHIIEHLGLKLYQNKPTNVIAELVSNGWDADATRVWIDLKTAVSAGHGRYLAAGDDGTGMTFRDLADEYLVIGKPKDRSDARKRKRYPMGRKGIGKLAPFGIAHTVDVITVAAVEGRNLLNWIRLDLQNILEIGGATSPSEQASYPPEIILRDAKVDAAREQADPTGSVGKFLDEIKEGTGTLVLLSNLSLLRAINAQGLRQAMGRRFTVTLSREDFEVVVDGKRIEPEDALPSFEFRVPAAGWTTEPVGGQQVRYWVGFVKTADWPSDEAGVGVYAHGKIAQDRPFTFGLRGREIFTRYMYGVIEADYLDELEEDVISTDRRSIDWDHPSAAVLFDWGQKKVRQWIEDYRVYRRKDEVRAVRKRIEDEIASGELPNIRDDEKAVIADLLAEVTPGLGKDEAAKSKITAAVMKAYLHRPTREILKKLWSEYSKTQTASADFLDMAEKLAAAAVPEAMSLAVTFAQRAFALSVLYDMEHLGKEPDLQKLIEKFPWILKPEMEKLTANQRLKTLVEAAWHKGLTPSRITPEHVEVNDAFKPDFVFFSDIDKDHIVVVEIKSPQEDLNFKNREQLSVYMLYIEQNYPKAKRQGFLVGTNGQDMNRGREDIEILSWSEVFRDSRRGHVDMLAAMLSTANPDPDDDRMKQILEFGGDKVWELLERVAANDEDLAELLSTRPSL